MQAQHPAFNFIEDFITGQDLRHYQAMQMNTSQQQTHPSAKMISQQAIYAQNIDSVKKYV